MKALDRISRRFGWRIFRIPRTFTFDDKLAVYTRRIP